MSPTVVATAFGGPEVLSVIDADVPEPGPGEVVVDFRAIGVNPIDHKLYSGAFGTDESQLPKRLGSEGAGVVSAVGPDAVGPAGPIAVGDEVIAFRGVGTYASRAVQPASSIIPKPAGLDWEQAGGLLLTAATAYDALEVLGVGQGDTVLIHGAAGGVGLLAVQLARLRGATVIGTGREVNHDYLRSIGAQPTTYGDGLADRVRDLAPGGITAAFDTVGADEAVDVSLELVADRSRIVTTAAFERAQAEGFGSIGGSNPDSAERRDAARQELVGLAGEGKLVNVVAKTFPLADVATAHSELQQPHDIGKFILLP
ncbi:NADP-dependent oxidoreductase [Williamsia phyllosphaerae]|uniref:Oxidoreductase n=1 Tax=Williamsia phyllosphaerae TaxID=885042 RepID=A0ABQ1U4E0_9NOCA|nr:NADP-dependent oxidoreductase [Williamsia phyllosphaerae]GGF09378.1 putative oxidoreductase [Williamsia phyllosphaerae]